jgi:hypothetical protein
MFYGGENNVPGAPGNVGAYGNMFKDWIYLSQVED